MKRARVGSAVFVIAAILLARTQPAPAQEAASTPGRLPNMPEPLLEETVTDIDGATAGELEMDATGSWLAPRSGRAPWSSEVEAEWRVTRRLGFAAELSVGAPPPGQPDSIDAGVRLATALSLIHAWAYDFHAQVEATGRFFESREPLSLGDSALPYSVDLRTGLRRGWLTMRSGLGVGIDTSRGGDAALRASLALLGQVGPPGRFFAGFEVVADFGRSAPFVIAPEAAYTTGTTVPVRLGVALPWLLDRDAGTAAYGVLARVMLELDVD
jgi:hypothetical protein